MGFYSKNTYSYMDSATGVWQMRAQDHDPANTRTLDSSGNGNHLTFGAGAATPTKIARHHGYALDGADDYFSAALGLGFFSSAAFSIMVEFAPDYDFDTANFFYFFDLDNGAAGNRTYFFHHAVANEYYLYITGTLVATITEATMSTAWRIHQRNVLFVVATSGSNVVYLNGQVLANTATAWATPADTTRLTLGSAYDGSSNFDGDMRSFVIIQQQLTPLQIEDATVRLQQKVNDL